MPDSMREPIQTMLHGRAGQIATRLPPGPPQELSESIRGGLVDQLKDFQRDGGTITIS